jgi:hypothetical protein
LYYPVDLKPLMTPPLTRITRRAAILAWIAAATAACQSRFGPSDEVFQDALRRWRDARLRDYSMVVTQMTRSGTPVSAARVTVRDSVVVDRRDVETGDPVPLSEAALYPDVPQLFGLLEQAFGRASAVQASYDAANGHPAFVFIEYDFANPSNFVRLSVSQFTAGAGAPPP